MEEVWKDVAGFEGLYQVSNLGRVRSVKVLSPYLANGYLEINLKNRVRKKVHRLVAEAFIPNPNGFPIINHKDENKQNNCVENLEWCTTKYNSNYGNAIQKMINTQKKNGTYKATPVLGISLKDGSMVKFESISEAARFFGGSTSAIFYCLKKTRKSYLGYIWKYA